MRRAFLALLIGLCAVPLGQARDALAAIDACVQLLDGLDVGYERIAARCPDLTPSLKASPWEAWLPRDWNRPHNQLSAAALVELRALLQREAARTPSGHELRTSTVSGVLAALTQADPPRTWWQRFRSWLRDLLTPRPQPAPDGWLQRLLIAMHLPPALARWIGWLSLALLAASGLAIVLNELRVAGVFASRWGRGARVPAVGGGAAPGVRLEELELASLSQQPRLLLELVATRLVQQSRLPPARALTVRELSGAARLEDLADRARLSVLASTCERVRFSDQEVAPAILARALAQGRELLASLDAAPAQLGA
ncbi:MAG TPA: hypothetical protein VK676_14515 [Steroidobacteraceae bacterium]|jgi:hypothetical protein|nr:hypothetical protein [Steroidobacteraceae bacterium]